MTRVLVTGAQGFIGRATVLEWLRTDPTSVVWGLGRSSGNLERFTHEVTWRSRRWRAPLDPASRAALADERYRYFRADLADGARLSGLLRELKPDIIVHLAAALRDQPPTELVEVNVGGVASLLEAVVVSGIDSPRIVIGSSGSVYGVVVGRGLPLEETMPCAPIDPYSATKRASEDLSLIMADQHGLDLMVARIFNPVGPGQDERHLCGWLGRQIASIAAGHEPPEVAVGPLHTTRDYIDVRDTASALLRIAVDGASLATYNVATGIETGGDEVLDRLVTLAGVSLRVSKRPLSPRRADMDRHVADISRLSALGWAADRSLDDSLHDVLNYYRHEVEALARPRRANPVESRAVGSADANLALSTVLRHSYDIEVSTGVLRRLPSLLGARFPGARLVVLTDDRVAGLYGIELVDQLRSVSSMTADLVVVPEGEASKTLTSYQRVARRLHELRFDRRSVLVNLGGGMITDLGGFVAATYLRGVAYVNVPTTLLSQHDSAIGGKVAVNAPWAKNFMGAFHQPHAVYCDPDTLLTLSDRDLTSGVAEAIKVALCGAPGLFEFLEQRVDAIMSRDVAALEELVRRCVEHKIALLEPDPYEVDLRRALNLGHTFGHALEVELDYEDIQHGQAVAFGIAIATLIAVETGRCDPCDADRVLGLIARYQVLPEVEHSRLHAAGKAIDEVRLVRGGSVHYVVPTGLRSVEILAEIETELVTRAVDSLAAHPLLGRSVRT